MAVGVHMHLDEIDLNAEECSLLVRGGSTGRIAFLAADDRIALRTVRYAVDAGTIVWWAALAELATERSVPMTFEAFGSDAGGAWSVVLKGRGRRILRDTDVRRIDMLLLENPGPGHTAVRMNADTISGVRFLPSHPRALALGQNSR